MWLRRTFTSGKTTTLVARTFHALGREILVDAGVWVANLVDRTDVLRALNGGRRVSPASLRRFDDGFSRLKLDQGLSVDAATELLRTPDSSQGDLLRAFVAYERWLAQHDRPNERGPFCQDGRCAAAACPMPRLSIGRIEYRCKPWPRVFPRPLSVRARAASRRRCDKRRTPAPRHSYRPPPSG